MAMNSDDLCDEGNVEVGRSSEERYVSREADVGAREAEEEIESDTAVVKPRAAEQERLPQAFNNKKRGPSW